MPRQSLVDKTGHREEVEHLLIDQKWSSRTVQKYLALKYNVDIPHSSLRTWRSRRLDSLKKAGKLPEQWQGPAVDDQSARARITRLMAQDDGIPDVMSRRLALIKLQEARIALDAEHEFAMGKQFVSQAKEIELLNRLYNDAKNDMQDLGIWPKPEAAAPVTVNAYGGAAQAGAAAVVPQVDSKALLQDALPDVDPDVIRQAGRALVLVNRAKTED